MKNIISVIINKHITVMRYIVVLGLVFWISTFFPRNHFNYDYELNKPWKYENLLAPFSYTIKKNPDSLLAEQKRALQNFNPYYSINPTIKEKVKSSMLQDFGVRYQKLKLDTSLVLTEVDSLYYLDVVSAVLDTVYARGIIYLNEEHKVGGSPIKSVNLIGEKNIGKLTRVSALFNNSPSACKYISNYLKALPDSNAVFLIPVFCSNLIPDVQFDSGTSEKIKADLQDISPTSGKVQQGEVIIAQGALVDPDRLQALNSLKDSYSSDKAGDKEKGFFNKYIADTGYFLITFLVLSVFVFFMRIYEARTFSRIRELSFILFSVALFLLLISKLVNLQQVSLPNLSLYVLPFCVIPIIIRNFFGSWVAHYVHIVTILLAGFIVPLGYEFLFVHFVAGLVAIITNEKTYHWSDFFFSTSLIMITYCLAYLGVSLIQENSWDNIHYATFAWLAVNALLTLLAYQLIPVFEKLLGFISNITLVEMSDLNRDLLKRLAKVAPGTFWHSLQVSNLAEAAASEIGANALLAKVGALYHDIGKMVRPVYFIENQKTEINPHDDLPYEESARIIIEHVTKGIEIAKKEKLPNIIIDFIRTHHGNTRTEYFYLCYLKQVKGEDVDDKAFRYPGPLPYNKETAIVMMADSIEAASRSLKNPNEEDINRLVDSIVGGKIQQNQFVNCDISFKDITAIKKVFKKQLRSIYHIRISYPVEKPKAVV